MPPASRLVHAEEGYAQPRRRSATRTLVSVAAALLLAGAASPTAHDRQVIEPVSAVAQRLRTGDLVFRRGIGLESLLVLSIDRGFRYSHVGLVVSDALGVRVIHAIPRTTEEKTEDGVVIESLETYLAPQRASEFAVYRLAPGVKDAAAIGRAAAQKAGEWASERRPFDHAFDSASADALYCTELIYRSLAFGGLTIDLPSPSADLLGTGLERGPILLPSQILNGGYFERVIAGTIQTSSVLQDPQLGDGAVLTVEGFSPT